MCGMVLASLAVTLRSYLPHSPSALARNREKRRMGVILALLGNIFFQVCLQIAAIRYYSYSLDQSAPGE